MVYRFSSTFVQDKSGFVPSIENIFQLLKILNLHRTDFGIFQLKMKCVLVLTEIPFKSINFQWRSREMAFNYCQWIIYGKTGEILVILPSV